MARHALIVAALWGLVWSGLGAGPGLAQTPISPAPPAAPLDLAQADAFVTAVFAGQDSARYVEAADAYLALLGALGGTAAPDEAVRRRHLLPLRLILPDALRRETGLAGAEAALTGRLPAHAGARWVAWWRSVDPLPATPLNERLLEHLERVAYVQAHFADATTAAAFDDRGAIYLRLGPPSHQTQISFIEEQTRSASFLNQMTFYENRFWVYRQVHDAAQYLFLRRKQKEGYRLGLPEDLVPSSLRTPRKTRQLLTVLETIYRELALWHPRGPHGLTYDRLADYANQLAMYEFSRPLLGSDSPNRPQRPFAFVQRAMMQAYAEDKRAAHVRDVQVPASYSNVMDAVEPLPVDLRYARFLDDDGTTRTELYWSLHARDLRPSRRLRQRLEEAGHTPPPHYRVDLSVVQYTADFSRRAEGRQPLVVPALVDSAASGGEVPVQTFTARGDTGRYHLALQWSAAWARLDSADAAHAVQTGPTLKVAALRVDSLDALHATPDRLEMSDLKPLRATDAAALDDAPPYPHPVLTPDVPLALYFEVYHLTFGADDRTHYQVAYEVVRRDEKGGVLPLRRDVETRTASQTAAEGGSRTAREVILLELSDLDGVDALGVTVTVTDAVTGASAERTLRFTVQR